MRQYVFSSIQVSTYCYTVVNATNYFIILRNNGIVVCSPQYTHTLVYRILHIGCVVCSMHYYFVDGKMKRTSKNRMEKNWKLEDSVYRQKHVFGLNYENGMFSYYEHKYFLVQLNAFFINQKNIFAIVLMYEWRTFLVGWMVFRISQF